MKEWIIETNALTKRIGKRTVVDGVGLRVPQGSIYGFLGPNGAGKTTTIRMLLGLARPTSGGVRLFGRDMQRERLAVLKRVGSLVEYPSYYGHLTAYENLEALRRLLGAPQSAIDEALRTVRLDREAHRPVKGFSLGMKQRLGIAAALLGSPELLVLDEPTNGLDPAGILEIRELIRRMPQERGITILISSHLLSEIEQTATEVGIIAGGRLIYQDAIEALRRRARIDIRLRVNDPAAAAELLQEDGIGAAPIERGVSFQPASDAAVAGAVRRLVEGGIDVYRVEEAKASLEELFLELTGGEASL
ncbi:ATP-binding cassette domain-containing protein [Paenibacillus sp.]|uniref:ATP-binding cassette domain-containing protein n=1 Tax=Paenibacillus sp. TaxID=58172 RepID=UPI002D5FE81E|nr:ATP-binding cassette domain-containing protein [Paenibacillus sp.]HZG84753.1 ATP-binding cassette domain-containing protein [Paenibacillus sp.]